jgi:hypothetical protein
VPDTDHNPGLAELSRQVRDVLTRFEVLANKLEANFLSKEIFKLYSDGVTRELEHVSKALDVEVKAEKERNDQLGKRISDIEGNITWLVRVIVAAIVVALIAGLGIAAKAGGGG